jgi:DNA modification methylase
MKTETNKNILGGSIRIINGDSLEILKTYPDNHFDSVVTDPPY